MSYLDTTAYTLKNDISKVEILVDGAETNEIKQGSKYTVNVYVSPEAVGDQKMQVTIGILGVGGPAASDILERAGPITFPFESKANLSPGLYVLSVVLYYITRHMGAYVADTKEVQFTIVK